MRQAGRRRIETYARSAFGTAESQRDRIDAAVHGMGLTWSPPAHRGRFLFPEGDHDDADPLLGFDPAMGFGGLFH